MRKLLIFVVIFACAYLFINESAFATKSDKKIGRKKSNIEETPKDSPYKKMTGRDSLQMSGVVNVIAKGDTFYIEIPVNLFGRKFLVVNRMQQVQQELNIAGINKGIAYQNQTITFEMISRSLKSLPQYLQIMTLSPRSSCYLMQPVNWKTGNFSPNLTLI